MTTTKTDACARCGASFPDTELAAVTALDTNPANPGPWFTVCQSCAEGDGVVFEMCYRLQELRAGTLFGWWKHHGFFTEADKDDE